MIDASHNCRCGTCLGLLPVNKKTITLTNTQRMQLDNIDNKHKGLRVSGDNTLVVVDPSSSDLISYEQRLRLKNSTFSTSEPSSLSRYAPSGVDISGSATDASFSIFFMEFNQGTTLTSPTTDGSYICSLYWANGETGFDFSNNNYTACWNYNTSFATPNTCLKFGFGDGGAVPTPLSFFASGVTSWNEAEKNCMRIAIQQWAYLSGMPIYEEDISGNTDTQIQNKCNLKLYICESAQSLYSGLEGVCWPPSSPGPLDSSDPFDNNSYSGYLMMVRNVNTKYWGDSLSPGGYGYNVALHELGHGMGYAHPFDRGGGYSNIWPGVNTSLSNYQFYLYDNSYNQNVYSTMTYAATSYYNTFNYYLESNGTPNISPYSTWTTYNRNWRITPAPIDCVVFFKYYGYVGQTGTSNVTYYLDPSLNTFDDVGWTTINDRTAGKITIDASGIATNIVIDLRRTQIELLNGEMNTYGITTPDLNRMSFVLPSTGIDLQQGGYSISQEATALGGIDASASNIATSNTSVYSNVGIPTKSNTGQLGPSTIYGGAGNTTVFYSQPQAVYTFEIVGDFMKVFVTTDGESNGSDLLEMSSVTNVAFTNGDGSIDVVPLDTICFAEGTTIMIIDPHTKITKYVPVETLRPGDKVVTHTHGPVKILAIVTNKNLPIKNVQTMNSTRSLRWFKNSSLYLLRTEDHAELTHPLYLTGGHSLLKPQLSEREKKEMSKINWPKHFYKVDGMWKVLAHLHEHAEPVVKSTRLYNLILEQDDMGDMFKNYGIYANGMLIESCNLEYISRVSSQSIETNHIRHTNRGKHHKI